MLKNPLLLSLLFPILLSAEEVSVTIYSSADPHSFDPQQYISQQRTGHNPQWVSQVPGFGVVRELRSVSLQKGENTLRFTNVARFIDPTTVSIRNQKSPESLSVLEQNFEFDLVNPGKLLDRYIDQEIEATIPDGDKTKTLRGTLLSTSQNQLVLNTAEGVRIVNRYLPQLKLGTLPKNFITRPTLVWKLHSKDAGRQNIQTSYQTNGMTLQADYNLVLNQADTKANLNAWVTLMNLSGRAYENARLKLIAGDVQKIQPKQHRSYRKEASDLAVMEAGAAGFQEKSFFEYHLYTLPRKTDILSNTTQQITLFPAASNVDVEKVLVYYGLPDAAHWRMSPVPRTDRHLGNQSNSKVDVYIRFENEKKNSLGIPFPKGKVRVYKEDSADNSLEFIGEDLIDHTPKDETILIKLGQAFDIVGERKQTDYQVNTGSKTLTETIQIELRNHSKEEKKILIRENLFRWLNWEILEKSDDFEKVDSRTVHFPVTVPVDGKKIVNYKVRYSW